MQQSAPNADELTLQIGRICVGFSMVEFHLKLIVGKLLTSDGHIAAIVVSEAPFKVLVGMAKSLVYYKTEDANLRKLCDALAKRLTESEQLRNSYLHSQWMPVAGQKMEFTGKYIRAKNTAKVRHGLHQKWEIYTGKELAADVENLVKLSNDLSDFDVKLMKAKASAIHMIGLKLSPDIVELLKQFRTETTAR